MCPALCWLWWGKRSVSGGEWWQDQGSALCWLQAIWLHKRGVFPGFRSLRKISLVGWSLSLKAGTLQSPRLEPGTSSRLAGLVLIIAASEMSSVGANKTARVKERACMGGRGVRAVPQGQETEKVSDKHVGTVATQTGTWRRRVWERIWTLLAPCSRKMQCTLLSDSTIHSLIWHQL